MSEFIPTPLTNRGVVRTRDNDNELLRTLVDWLQITLKDVSPKMICDDLLRIPFNMMKEDNGGGTNGYHALYRFDNIRVMEASGQNVGNGYQVYMTGTGCRNYELILQANNETWFDLFQRILDFGANVPRMDLAVDDFKTYFYVGKLIKLAKSGRVVSRLRVGSETGGFTLQDGTKKGSTLYLGSHKSLVFFRFYEKNYEQAEKFGLDESERLPKWNRYEVVLRQEKAVLTVKQLVKQRSMQEVVMGIFKTSMRFVNVNPEDSNRRRWDTWEPWEWFLKDIKNVSLSVDPKEMTLEDFFGWLHVSIAPSLRVVYEIDKMLGTDYLFSMIENAKLKKKHEEMIDRFSAQLSLNHFGKDALVGD